MDSIKGLSIRTRMRRIRSIPVTTNIRPAILKFRN
jgi:hypothetical protein